ncbi:MAG TPA: hypothetical protein VF397_06250 [Pyrinomonadaceae bacterium]
MTILKLLLALLLSLIATFVISTVYVFFPLIVVLLKHLWGTSDSSGVFAVSGGIQSRAFLLIEPIAFVIIFLLLNRKQTA